MSGFSAFFHAGESNPCPSADLFVAFFGGLNSKQVQEEGWEGGGRFFRARQDQTHKHTHTPAPKYGAQ